MARGRSPERDKAFELYQQHNGEITNREIANQLGLSEKTVSGWKCKDKWDKQLNGVLQKEIRSTPNNTEYSERQEETPPFPGQCEAIGHKTGKRCRRKAIQGEKFCAYHLDGYREDQCTAKSRQTKERCKNQAEPGRRTCKFHGGRSNGPIGYQNGLKHGFFAKIFPDDEETRALVDEIINKSPLDILWENITIQYLAIARAQKIMFVTDKHEMIKELKKFKSQRDSNPRHDPKVPDSEPFEETYREEEWEFQFAWDRQATLLNAQAKAMKTLDGLISRYEELVEKYEKRGYVVEEHRLMVEKLKSDISTTKSRLDLEKARLLLEVKKIDGESKENQHANALRRKMAERKIKNGDA